MKLLQNNKSNNFVLNINNNNNFNANKNNNIELYEKETLPEVINIPINYEMVRYFHEKYNDIPINDIIYYFYFYNDASTHAYGGLDYTMAGITERQNTKMLKENSSSFFKLDFYYTNDNNYPNYINKKFLFSKILTIPLGEKVFSNKINDYISVPIFCGSSIYNTENMFLYWFYDNPLISTDIVFFTASFFNGNDGSITKFINKPKAYNDFVVENEDYYFKMILDLSNKTYIVLNNENERLGTLDNPIRFYQIPYDTLNACDIPEIVSLEQTGYNELSINYTYNNDIKCNGIKILVSNDYDNWVTYTQNCKIGEPAVINLSSDGLWYVKLTKICDVGNSGESEITSITIVNDICDVPFIERITHLGNGVLSIEYNHNTDITCNGVKILASKNEINWLTYTQNCIDNNQATIINLPEGEYGVWYFKLIKMCSDLESDESIIISYDVVDDSVCYAPQIINVVAIDERLVEIELNNINENCLQVRIEYSRTLDWVNHKVFDCEENQKYNLTLRDTDLSWNFRVKVKCGENKESEYSQVYTYINPLM
jgi:hypothetical protein